MPLLQNVFLAFLFIFWIKQYTKTMQKMGIVDVRTRIVV